MCVCTCVCMCVYVCVSMCAYVCELCMYIHVKRSRLVKRKRVIRLMIK